MQSHKKSKSSNVRSVFVLRLLSFIFFVLSLVLLNQLFHKQQSNIENSILNSKRVELIISPYNEYGGDVNTPPTVSKFTDYVDDDYVDDIDDEIVVDDQPVKSENKDKNSINLNSDNLSSDKPAIILILKNLGLNINNSKAAINLPAKVNLGFSPYVKSLAQLQQLAKDKGHETLLHLPLELGSPILNNAGPYALSETIPTNQNRKRLDKIIALLGESQFIYTDENEIFTQDIENIKFLINELKKSNKFLLYGNGADNAKFNDYANIANHPVVTDDIIIDNNLSPESILNQLNNIEELAQNRGVVVASANIYPKTIEILSKWIATLESKNIDLLPISKIIVPNNNG